MNDPLPPGLPPSVLPMNESLLPDTTSDNYLIRLAFQYKSSFSPPRQSQFRVFSLLTYRDKTTPKGKIKTVFGTNLECCFIANNVCAERSALVQLKMSKGVHVLKVFIVSDSQEFLTPGPICREFMFDNYCNENTVIVTCGENKVTRMFTLGELYPFPNIYINTERERVLLIGRLFSNTAQSPLEYFKKVDQLQWANLYKQLLQLALTQSTTTMASLHPVCYVAGVVLQNNKFLTTTQHNAVEYGCSVDAVSRLGALLEAERRADNPPVFLLQCDQFGTLHAPSAVGRSYLVETGLGKLPMVVHTKLGPLKQIVVEDLIPNTPKGEELFKKQSKL